MNRLGVGNFRLSGSKWLAVEDVFRLSHTTLFGELLSYYYQVIPAVVAVRELNRSRLSILIGVAEKKAEAGD